MFIVNIRIIISKLERFNSLQRFMKKLNILLFFFIGFSTTILAQTKRITVEEIYGGVFRTEGMEALRSMKNGKQYTILNANRTDGSTSLDKYDYKTLAKIETIVSSSDLEGIANFSSYEFSDDESKLLLATEIEPIYRRSTLGVFYVYDLTTEKLTKISESKIQEPSISPDGSQLAYVTNNNIYLFDITAGTTKQLTSDGTKNSIINGITDWVYEEEFAFVKAYQWNSNGTKIAFLRFDETNVPEFSMDIYGQGLYPNREVFKYPKAGEVNAKVSLHIYDIKSGSTAQVDLGEPYYIPRIKWMHDSNHLSVQTINRHQDHLKLLDVKADDLSVSTLLEEKDDAYVDVTDNLTFLADDSFIWTSEKDGNNHIYLYGQDGSLVNQITKGSWEVTKYYGYDQNEDKVYYQSTENGSINRGVYSIETDAGNKKAIAAEKGTNVADFSSDFTYFINNFSSATTPNTYTLHKALNGKKVKDIINNTSVSERLRQYEMSTKEFSTISINGNDLNMGPGSQSVSNRWNGPNDYWHQMLASEGYIVVCVDGRGTGFKGRDFKKVTQKELGKYEVEDQIAVAKKLSELPYIDESRTGIWGWSYGGFMASNSILKGNDTFETAIAVAPVTSWRFYDTIYTERYMQTPQENASGYDENSPLSHVDKLKGNYLLVHGSGDDNVHHQNSMRMVEALVQANKPFDLAVYPDKNHGIRGGNTRIHLYNKMTNFLHENLRGRPYESEEDNQLEIKTEKVKG